MNKRKIKREDFFEKARDVAVVYGFSPIDKIIESYKGKPREKIRVNANISKDSLGDLGSILKFYFERGLHKERKPLFIFHSMIDKDTRSAITKSSREEESRFCLTLIGVDDPFSEALIIATANRILEELRVKKKLVRINSMGDRIAAQKYYSTLTKTFRKHIDLASVECAKAFNESSVDAHKLIFNEDHTELASQLPSTLKFLSEQDRTHFKTVIEYLDSHEIPYELANDVVNDVRHGIHTTFEIDCEEENIKIKGGRYDTLPNYLFKRKIPISSISMSLEGDLTRGEYKAKNRMNRNPKIFLLHSGYNARLKSLPLLSQLRDARILVEHCLHKIRVMDQLEERGKDRKYILILGQDEVNNNTVRLKKADTKSVKVIKMEDIERAIKSDIRLRR